MDSSNLPAYGFGDWVPFNKASKSKLIASLPINPGAYAIRCRHDFARIKGSSDILYIGKATNQRGLKGRVGQYFSPGPTQSTNIRLLALVGDSSDYGFAFVEISSRPEATALEARLLDQYENEHGELPPENKRR